MQSGDETAGSKTHNALLERLKLPERLPQDAAAIQQRMQDGTLKRHVCLHSQASPADAQELKGNYLRLKAYMAGKDYKRTASNGEGALPPMQTASEEQSADILPPMGDATPQQIGQEEEGGKAETALDGIAQQQDGCPTCFGMNTGKKKNKKKKKNDTKPGTSNVTGSVQEGESDEEEDEAGDDKDVDTEVAARTAELPPPAASEEKTPLDLEGVDDADEVMKKILTSAGQEQAYQLIKNQQRLINNTMRTFKTRYIDSKHALKNPKWDKADVAYAELDRLNDILQLEVEKATKMCKMYLENYKVDYIRREQVEEMTIDFVRVHLEATRDLDEIKKRIETEKSKHQKQTTQQDEAAGQRGVITPEGQQFLVSDLEQRAASRVRMTQPKPKASTPIESFDLLERSNRMIQLRTERMERERLKKLQRSSGSTTARRPFSFQRYEAPSDNGAAASTRAHSARRSASPLASNQDQTAIPTHQAAEIHSKVLACIEKLKNLHTKAKEVEREVAEALVEMETIQTLIIHRARV